MRCRLHIWPILAHNRVCLEILVLRNSTMRKIWMILSIVLLAALQVACEPEVGSDAWCEKMTDTPKGDWSTNDAVAYAEHCVFKDYDDG